MFSSSPQNLTAVRILFGGDCLWDRSQPAGSGPYSSAPLPLSVLFTKMILYDQIK